MKYEEIKEKLDKIVSGPIKPIPEDQIARFFKEMEQKCPKTKRSNENLKKCIPGGTQHQMTIKDPFVLTISRCSGTRMWDLDDNEYIDWLMSAGACILGHNYAPLRDEVIKVYQDLDPNVYYNNPWEEKAINQVKKCMPSIEMMQYFQSGTEADMAAIRIARAYTGKEKIIKFRGSYHGWCGQLCLDMHIPYSGNMEAHGIPGGCYKDIILVPLNEVEELEEALKRWTARGSGVAAVLVDPLGSDAGGLPTKEDWLKNIRTLCDKYEVLLIFDEVITGFRLNLGGAQEYFNVKPDLTVLGKLLTHGFPGCGAVGGSKEIMSNLTIDVEAGGNSAFVGGTMRGNPLTAASTYWTLKFMREQNTHQKATKAAEDLVNKLNDLFERDGRDFFAHNIGSIIHFETYSPLAMDIRNPDNIQHALKRKECVDILGSLLLCQGIITKYGNRGFTCMAHTPDDNDKFIDAFENVLKLIPK